ncbi:hypothetical protein EYF80_001369 [Liparis tanakae]|uniref:Uncharacterized protein n=1 Tax=Liparis tanakae TaxID=230148 RepID=A0A4Z2JEB9_9TELE|nr:hypothetical protein EYF80_001369 [Liparis tanakae]
MGGQSSTNQKRGNSRNPPGLWLKSPEGLPHALEKNVITLRPSESLEEGIGVHLVSEGWVHDWWLRSVRMS